MPKVKRNEVVNPLANIPITDSGTADVQAMAPHDRETYRQGKILELKIDELRNGIAQGQIFHEQLEEYCATDAKTAQTAFSNFCKLCGEAVSEAKKKINRFLFVSSFANGTEREAVSMLRGTLIDNVEKLKLSDKQRRELASSLAKRYSNMALSTDNLKKVQKSINSLAKAILVKPLGGPGGNPREKENGKKKTSVTPDVPPVTESAPPVRDVQPIKGFRYLSPDDLLSMTLEQRTDALRKLVQACHQAVCLVETEPYDYLSPDSFDEFDSLLGDCRRDMKDLRKRLAYRNAATDSAMERVA